MTSEELRAICLSRPWEPFPYGSGIDPEMARRMLEELEPFVKSAEMVELIDAKIESIRPGCVPQEDREKARAYSQEMRELKGEIGEIHNEFVKLGWTS